MSNGTFQLPEELVGGNAAGLFLLKAHHPARSTGIQDGEWVIAREQPGATGVVAAMVDGDAVIMPHSDVPAGGHIVGKAVAVLRCL